MVGAVEGKGEGIGDMGEGIEGSAGEDHPVGRGEEEAGREGEIEDV
jgi:hypothetical protein